MKVSLKNLGPLKSAEFELGDLTVICGKNNTGKTYATYALHGFYSHWTGLLGWRSLSLELTEKDTAVLNEKGEVCLNLKEYAKIAAMKFPGILRSYSQHLPRVFDMPNSYFATSQFNIEDAIDLETIKNAKFQITINIIVESIGAFSVNKEKDSFAVLIKLPNAKNVSQTGKEMLRQVIGQYLKELIFPVFHHDCFIVSAERTGIAVFRKELDFSRDKLLERIKNEGQAQTTLNDYFSYSAPVRNNIEFARRFESLSKEASYIEKEHPEILKNFRNILGGIYVLTGNDILSYIPEGTDKALTMNASSSSVRSLLYLGFYLKHAVKKGDLLIIDEPELNLHPENQCLIARLLARLVNLGIKVFITTHSDYIVKELNTLIMLNQKTASLQKIAHDEGYSHEELIAASQVRLYTAENGTLTPANIDEKLGIEAKTFDATIDKMNQIQEKIVWENNDDEN